MSHRLRLFMPLLIAAVLLLAPRIARAQNAPAAITIDGLVMHPITFTPRDLVWLPPTQLGGGCADGSQHAYAGIDLAGVLAAAGLQNADPLQSYITVSGADGHSVLIAWEEIDRLAQAHSLVGPVLALDYDGAPLTEGGPVKLVWDGCPSARDVDDVQRITVGSFGQNAGNSAPPQQVESAPALAAAGLSADDLPGLTRRYLAQSQGAASAALPLALSRGYWATDDGPEKAIDSLRTFLAADASRSTFAALTPSVLAPAFNCAPTDVQDLGAQGIGDGDDLSSWDCVDASGAPEQFYAEVFYSGRVVGAVIAINPPGAGGQTVTTWAQSVAARLATLAQ
jgi:DMSO/TMAO reductase YedYZ molybdopterin-dependent catalytic subunit